MNGILLTSSRLFYAGACEGQMPEILTMIQIQRYTPTPAVLAMALLSMLYLTVSDIFALINYVGFATWVSVSTMQSYDDKYLEFRLIRNYLHFTVEHWRCRIVLAVAAMGSTKSTATNPCPDGIPNCLFIGHNLCHCRAHVCQPRRDRIWLPDDSHQCTSVHYFHCLAQQTQVVPTLHG